MLYPLSYGRVAVSGRERGYRVRGRGAQSRPARTEDVLHVTSAPCPGRPDRVSFMSPVDSAVELALREAIMA